MKLCYNGNSDKEGSVTMEIDPVCGMEVDPKTAEYTSIYQGKTYYFCSSGCKKDFDKEPQKYVKAGTKIDKHQHQHGHSA
jgi:YHS domain-containing protein